MLVDELNANQNTWLGPQLKLSSKRAAKSPNYYFRKSLHGISENPVSTVDCQEGEWGLDGKFEEALSTRRLWYHMRSLITFSLKLPFLTLSHIGHESRLLAMKFSIAETGMGVTSRPKRNRSIEFWINSTTYVDHRQGPWYPREKIHDENFEEKNLGPLDWDTS